MSTLIRYSPQCILAGVMLVTLAALNLPSLLLCGIALCGLGAACRLIAALDAPRLLLALNALPYVAVFLLALGGGLHQAGPTPLLIIDATLGASLLALQAPIVAANAEATR